MGAGYHTIHHTLYNYNYGHYFTFVDRWVLQKGWSVSEGLLCFRRGLLCFRRVVLRLAVGSAPGLPAAGPA